MQVHTYNRDGFMRADENGGDSPNYEPNSFGGPAEDPRYRELPYKVSGEVNRYNHREGNDDYKQAGDLFRLMSKADEQALISNIAGHMKGIPERIARLQIEHFTEADPAYGAWRKPSGWQWRKRWHRFKALTTLHHGDTEVTEEARRKPEQIKGFLCASSVTSASSW